MIETQAGPLLQQVVWKSSSNRRRKCKQRSKKDLIALRSTSKTQDIHTSATQEFAKRYFEELRVMWTPYSFLKFCKICESPVLGHYAMQSIT